MSKGHEIDDSQLDKVAGGGNVLQNVDGSTGDGPAEDDPSVGSAGNLGDCGMIRGPEGTTLGNESD